MRIGELAQHTGVSTKTIRYYEDIGVLPQPERSANDYRDYSPNAIDRLRFVRDAQATGLTLTEIASILELRSHSQSTCDHVTELLEHHLRDLDEHLDRLQRTRQTLSELTERARRLDPATCTDPNRCQTISTATGAKVRAKETAAHLHETPHRHDHQ
jgi:DNA-binding transcriptional MerR regulator